MPRKCVLCGKSQSKLFSVFLFPVSPKQRSIWINVLKESRPDLFQDEKNDRQHLLKNGVCQLHFLSTEISCGKKRRLTRQAVPSIGITNSLLKSTSIINSYKSLVLEEKNDLNVCNASLGVLPECTVKLEVGGNDNPSGSPAEVEASFVDDIFRERVSEATCLCCEAKHPSDMFVSVLKKEVDDKSLLHELAAVLEVPKEKVVAFSTSICRKCLMMIKHVAELKKSITALVLCLKKGFKTTSANLETVREKAGCLEVDNVALEIALLNNGKKISDRLMANSKKYCCNVCKKEFSSFAIYAHHNHEEEKQVNSLNLRGKILTDNSRLQCPVCKKVYLSHHDLKLHTKMHKQNFDCSYCGRLMTSKARLQFHLHKFHNIGEGKEKNFHCSFCEKQFSTQLGLQYHEWSVHNTGRPYTCELCDKVFPYKMLYKSHKLHAHGKKSIVCEVCGQMFFTVSKLNTHINAVHRNALSWHCKICNEKFATTASYREHTISKHRRIKHDCFHCDAKFVRKNSLAKHLRKHGVFLCQRCGNRSSDSASYVTHMMDVHKTNVEGQFSSVRDEETQQMIPSTLAKDEEVNSVVINDILITSKEFGSNSTLKVAEAPFDSASSVPPLGFVDASVHTLDIDSVTNVNSREATVDDLMQDSILQSKESVTLKEPGVDRAPSDSEIIGLSETVDGGWPQAEGLEEDPPVTQHIDITLPADGSEEAAQKESLSDLSVDFDAKGDVHYKYVVY